MKAKVEGVLPRSWHYIAGVGCLSSSLFCRRERECFEGFLPRERRLDAWGEG